MVYGNDRMGLSSAAIKFGEANPLSNDPSFGRYVGLYCQCADQGHIIFPMTNGTLEETCNFMQGILDGL